MGTSQEQWRFLRDRAQSQEPSGPRLLVGAGSCGQAVGALEVAAELRKGIEKLGLRVAVVESGCTGMCYGAVQVTLLGDGVPATYSSITPSNASASLAAILKKQTLSFSPEAFLWSSDSQNGLPGVNSIPFLAGQRRILLERCGLLDPEDILDAVRHGAYGALAGILTEGNPSQVIAIVKESGLVGRGGAYFPVAVKWEGCRAAPGEPKYLVVNAEEGEPGIFKDRHLMEGNPHGLLEGMLIAAYAAGSSRGFLFVNGEAKLSFQRLSRAVDQARSVGLIGKRILGSDFSFEVELRQGSGGFVLGEETALLESIEGRRAMPRVRPPFPVESGLWGKPTVINNVETLSNVPALIGQGAGWFQTLGTGKVHGTKLFGLSGNVARPGVAEVELGRTLRDLIFSLGGGVAGGAGLKAVLLGGPSGSLIPPQELDLPLEPGGKFPLGSGGVVALDDHCSILDIAHTLIRFNANESCGKCTPCREGTARMAAMIARLEQGRVPSTVSDEIENLSEVVRLASLCGLGQAAPYSVLSGLRYFPET